MGTHASVARDDKISVNPLKELKDDYAAIKKEKDDLASKVSELESQAKQREGQNELLQQRNSQLEKEKDDLLKKITSLEGHSKEAGESSPSNKAHRALGTLISRKKNHRREHMSRPLSDIDAYGKGMNPHNGGTPSPKVKRDHRRDCIEEKNELPDGSPGRSKVKGDVSNKVTSSSAEKGREEDAAPQTNTSK